MTKVRARAMAAKVKAKVIERANLGLAEDPEHMPVRFRTVEPW